ncbi:MAG: hypothetical protein WCP69_12740 [Bacteroidota bacterium]
MKKIFLILLISLTSAGLWAQETTTVEVKGQGLKRDDAIQDALRAAVGQAVGVAVSSETKVENFMVLSDAISTKTEGYIASYKVVKETPFPDRFEVIVSAVVSLNPLKADINLLSKSIGGVRFMVMYDPRAIAKEDVENYDYATERINEALSKRKYRYIEKTRFDALKKEAQGIGQESGDFKEETYVQNLGFKADAQFLIKISKITVTTKSEAFDTRNSSKIIIEAKAYDNCTAEGLGTIIMESAWNSTRDVKSSVINGITQAINDNIEKLLGVFNSYIGDWVNNGTPFELRFYASGSFRDFRDLRTKLKADANFGGQLEIVSFDNYSKLNCTFRKKPDELADIVLDYADQVPFFKEKQMDVRLIFGRQISFAPRTQKIPELDNASKNQTTTPSNSTNVDNSKGTNVVGSPKTNTVTTPKTTTPAKKTVKKVPVKKSK